MAGTSIYILLTKYPDTLSKVVAGITRGYYSHVSIGFDESCSEFYSFTQRGFHIEDPKRISAKRKAVPCSLYKLDVSQTTYDLMKSRVNLYRSTSSVWKYNLLGVLFGVMQIPYFRRKHHRFCSQFVAEILEAGNAVSLTKEAAVMLPKDFLKMKGLDLSFQGTLSNLAVMH